MNTSIHKQGHTYTCEINSINKKNSFERIFFRIFSINVNAALLKIVHYMNNLIPKDICFETIQNSADQTALGAITDVCHQILVVREVKTI